MKPVTIVVLAGFAAALGVLAWRELARDARGDEFAPVALVQGLDANLVTAIRIENVARDTHVRLELDPKEGWLVVDPVRIPADTAVVEFVMRTSIGRTGTPLTGTPDPKLLGFEPPTMVLEFESAGVRRRLEVGAPDIDGERVHVRVDGRIVLAPRDLHTALDRDAYEYRTRHVTTMRAGEIVEFHRQGALVLENQTEPTLLDFDALAERGAWRATAPVEAALDPLAMAMMTQGVAGLTIRAYMDSAGAPLTTFGLDPAAFSVEAASVGEARVKLLFAAGPTGKLWFSTRTGQPFVWKVEDRAAYLLAVPFEELLDHRFHRWPRAEIDGVELVSAERTLVLALGVDGWTVAEANPGSRVFGPALPAEKGRVEDLLGRLERAEFARFDRSRTLSEAESHDAIHVLAHGERQGGKFGSETPAAGEGLRFQRTDDGIVALVDPELREVARTSARSLWSLELLRLVEVSLTRLELSRADKKIGFARNSRGIWTREGADLEAKDLRDVLDALIFLRASEHLTDVVREPLENAIEVRFEGLGNAVQRFTIGLVAVGGETQAAVDLGGRRSILKVQALQARLDAILGH